MQTSPSHRIASIDLLRGIVMILMALDHTRDFFHQTAMTTDPMDTATTTPWLYFTRWITHFCAPAFVLLSGVSAFLASQKRSRGAASLFLVKRGIWLVIAEVMLITMGFTFNPFYNFIILQVIWAIGWSMIILGLISRISFKAVLITGLLLFFGHNLTNYITLPQTGTAAVMWTALLTSRGVVMQLDATHFVGVFYTILPWTGVMLLGYCLGYFYQKDYPAQKRKRFLLYTGASLTLLFIVLRSFSGYGNPTPWEQQSNLLSNVFTFLNTSKYPPSLQYLGMTLGPALIILSLLENVQAKWASVVTVYGSVPFFYYVLHFYLLHSLLVIVFFLTGHTASQIVDPAVPFLFRPADFGYGLPVVYLIWMAVVTCLYFPSRWFSNYKKRHRYWWLKYI